MENIQIIKQPPADAKLFYVLGPIDRSKANNETLWILGRKAARVKCTVIEQKLLS